MTSEELQSLGMKPRLVAIVSTDWPALLCAMSLPVLWLLSAQLPFVSRDAGIGGSDALAVALFGSVVALGLLAWRILRIHRLFTQGRLVRARIVRREVAGERVRLEFAYDFAGVQRTSSTRVYYNRRAEALRENQDIDVLVDPLRPHDAIVRDLYL